MPKEQINFPQIVTSSDSPVGYAASEPILRVGWNRAGWVQVSLSLEAGAFRRIADDYESYRDEAPTIYTEPLDRAEINKLIRTLRKARDAAYGTDA